MYSKGTKNPPKITVGQEELRKFHPVLTTRPTSSNKNQQSTAGGKAKAQRNDSFLCGADRQELLKAVLKEQYHCEKSNSATDPMLSTREHQPPLEGTEIWST